MRDRSILAVLVLAVVVTVLIAINTVWGIAIELYQWPCANVCMALEITLVALIIALMIVLNLLVGNSNSG